MLASKGQNKYENIDYNISFKRELKKSILGLLERLGQGLCEPVPYDTAWVARIPQADNLQLPAFPLSLQWLRDNQLENGSWGSMKPFSAYNNTLNTLAAVITLKQWDSPEDEIRIGRGVKALWELSNYLPNERYDGVGLELILPALRNEAQKHELNIPVYQSDEEKRTKKQKIISSQLNNVSRKPAIWYSNLEMLVDDKLLASLKLNSSDLFLSMLAKNGSIGLSPAATAYMLRSQRLKGIDVPEAYHYLERTASLYSGGVPHLFPIDTYELAFSIDLFLKAGFGIDHPAIKSATSRLAECWTKEGIGFSDYLGVNDADDTAVGLYILHKAGYPVSVDALLNFFNGNHIAAFPNELSSSASVNINALSTLRLFNGVKGVDSVIQRVITWLERTISSEKEVFFPDKWHISPYYTTSRAVFSFHGLRNDIAECCIKFLVKNQNYDGGWGKDRISTQEETAYVALALSYGLKHGYNIPKDILDKASQFLNKFKEHIPNAPIWLGKVLYCPSLISESAVVSARYALSKILETVKVKEMLRDIKYDCVDIEYNDNQRNYHGSLLCLTPDFDITKYSDQIAKIKKDIINKLVELKLTKTGETVLKAALPEASFYTIRSDASDEHITTNALLAMSLVICDNILDKDWQLFRDNSDIIKQALQIFLEILKGKYESSELIPYLEFPKFVPLCKLFFDIRNRVVERSNLNEFLMEIEKYFKCDIEEFNKRISGSHLSSKEFLEMSKITVTSNLFFFLSCMFEDIKLSSFKEDKLFLKFADYASKGARLI